MQSKTSCLLLPLLEEGVEGSGQSSRNWLAETRSPLSWETESKLLLLCQLRVQAPKECGNELLVVESGKSLERNQPDVA